MLTFYLLFLLCCDLVIHSFNIPLFFLPPGFSHCLSCPEEMRDLTESSAADPLPAVGIQSKGKSPQKRLPLALPISRGTSLFISRCLLVSAAAKLKFSAPDNPSALCSRLVRGFCSPPPPLSTSISLSLCGLAAGCSHCVGEPPPGPNAFVNALHSFSGAPP